jgi:CheY-like chemotaxis protein
MMDLHMPGMDGLTATRHIKTELGLGIVPRVILVTAHNPTEVEEFGDVTLLDNILSKPINPSLLFDVVMEAFGHEVTHAAKARRGSRHLDLEALRPIQGASLLLVEDNPINQQVATELLEQARFAVDIACNGREALDKLEHNKYDCVLMDVQMPVMDGYEATRRIRRREQFRDLPVLAMTANATLEDREAAEAAGMNGHIAKPIDPRELFSNLLQWVSPGDRELPQELPQEASAATSSLTNSDQALPEMLPGIDVEVGLKSIGDNRKLFRKLLVEFREDHREDVGAIRKALKSDEAALARRLAHTIKGVAATIGAKELNAAAAALEAAIKAGTSDGYESLITRLDNAMSPILEGLAALTDSSSVPVDGSPADPARIGALIEELVPLIEALDPDAEAKARELQRLLQGTAVAGRAGDLAAQAAGFQFDEAAATLAHLREQLAQTHGQDSLASLAARLEALEKLLEEMDPDAEQALDALLPAASGCVERQLLKKLISRTDCRVGEENHCTIVRRNFELVRNGARN